MENETFDEILVRFRSVLKHLAKEVDATKEVKSKGETNNTEDIGEVLANLTLAYRHIEDASMRIGKTIQARAGGKSPYDNTAVGTPGDKPEPEAQPQG